jgi:hypothetical protein
MADPIQPEVVKAASENESVRITKQGKPFRERKNRKIAELPEEVRDELNRRLEDSTYSYRLLSDWLEEEHAARIGPTSLHYHKKHHLDLKLLPVKYATQEARTIVEATGGDNEEINRALTMLVQTKIYEMLIQMNTVIEAFDQVQEANLNSRKMMRARQKNQQKKNAMSQSETADQQNPFLPQGPNKAAIAAVSALVKNTAAIGHHVIEAEKWDLDRDLKLAQAIQEAEQKVSKVANEAGLSPEVEKSIRDALMEIKP